MIVLSKEKYLHSWPIIVIDSTPVSRRNDLIFVTNGIPSDFLTNPKTKIIYDGIDKDLVTTSVPHFGVLGIGSDPISNESSPPTFIHGTNAKLLDDILSSSGLNTSIVQESQEVDAKAIRKLLWVSAMWLLCHDSKIGNADEFQPLTVKQVHEQRGEALNDILEELLPVANLLLQKYYPHSKEYSDKHLNVGSMEEVSKYMQDYSFSMPTAIPNKILAIDEFAQRNGNLLAMKKFIKQPIHEARIMNVVGFIPREGYF